MAIVLTKTDYILFRECAKNAWYKINRREIYDEAQLSEFEKAIMETGNEVELVARQLFPNGILLQDRSPASQQTTQDLLAKKTPVLFQPIFVKDGFLAAVDVLELNPDGSYNIYEVKSTTDVDRKTHYHDLAFQVNLLSKFGIKVSRASVIHLNSEYIKEGELNIRKLFTIADVTEEVENIREIVLAEMETAKKYLSDENEPKGHCSCVYKGRSNHCATFAYSNPDVPEYGVHDISRIGASKGKLQEMIDVGMFKLEDVSEDIFKTLTPVQQNQIVAYVKNAISVDRHNIQKELEALHFPLYFLDYETFPSAVPRFDGFYPYQQIPFQYSLYVIDSPTSGVGGLKHFEFLYAENTDPSQPLLKSLQENIGTSGSIIVWSKKFECKINEELAKRNKDFTLFIQETNTRVYDLMDIFGKQYYVHKDFKGRISIKNILPVLVPELSYKTLEIQEGGTASQKWNEAITGAVSKEDKEKILNNLKEYCKLDTLAMVKIWEYLYKLINT